MKPEPVSKATRISVETSASADLDQVVRWLLECRSNPLRLEAYHLPSLGQGARLMLAVPMTARRAVLWALWVLEDGAPGACLLSGPLRFVAPPNAAALTRSFTAPPPMAMTARLPYPPA